MDYRRSQLDDRRRRVLMEEVTAPADESLDTPAAGAKRTPTKAYGDAVLTDFQWRISDLVPVRPLALIVLILALLTGLAAIETIYIYWQTTPAMARAAARLPTIDLSAFDLTARGSVANWYSSLLLAAGACGALVVFSIRCHRVDDYRGRYRVWLWTCAGLLWASLDAATGIHESLGGLVGQLAGSPQYADLGWLGMYLVLFGVLGVRLGIETWHALGAFATLSLAAVLYLVVGMTTVGWITLPGYLLATVLETGLLVLAHITLICGLAIYARHVHLDAEGKLPLRLRMQGARPKKNKSRLSVVREDGEQSASDGDKVAAKTAAVSSSAPAARPGPLASRVAAAIADDDDDDSDETLRDSSDQLSKSERRRLKKLMRQQRRAA